MKKKVYILKAHNSLSGIEQDVETKLIENEKNRKVKDVGRVKNSAKEKAAYRIISMNNIDTINTDEVLAFNIVKKDAVWKAIDIEAQKLSGVSSGACFIKLKIREALPAKPENSAIVRKLYVKFLNTLQNDLLPLKTVTDIKKYIEQYKSVTKEFVYKAFFYFEGAEEGEEMKKQFEKNFPNALISSYALRSFMDAVTSKRFSNAFFVRSNSIFQDYKIAEKITFDDWNWNEKGENKKSSGTSKAPTINKKKPLDYIKVIGSYVTPEPTPENVTKHYGFSAFNFGKYVPDNERAEHAKHFITAMSDLGEVLNIDIKAVHQLGKLGFGIGLKGHAGHNAAYYPQTKDINLVRGKGDGSVAHEWGHYFDNVIIDGSTQKSVPGFASTTTDKDSIIGKLFIEFKTFCEVGSGKDVVELNFNPLSKKTYHLKKMATAEETIIELQRVYPQYKFISPKNAAEIVDIFGYIAKIHQQQQISCLFILKTSKLFYDTFLYSGGNTKYWLSSVELFARCFETYVYAKLNKLNRFNNYLAHDSYDIPGMPYPRSVELDAITVLFDKIVNAFKEKYSIGDFIPYSTNRIGEEITEYAKNTPEEITEIIIEPVKQVETKKQMKNEISIDLVKLEAKILNDIKFGRKEIADIDINSYIDIALANEDVLPRFIQFNNKLPNPFKYNAMLSSLLESYTGVKNPYFHLEQAIIPDIKPLTFKTIKGDKELAKILSKFVGKDDLRPIMSQAYFDEKGIVATDAHKMIFIKKKQDYKNGFECVTKTCMELAEDAKYLNYAPVIPSKGVFGDINVAGVLSFIETLEKNSCQEYSKSILLLVADQKAAYNAKCLKAALEAMLKIGHTKLKLLFAEQNKPLVIVPATANIEDASNLNCDFALIMPVMSKPEGYMFNVVAASGNVNCIYNSDVFEYAKTKNKVIKSVKVQTKQIDAEDEKGFKVPIDVVFIKRYAGLHGKTKTKDDVRGFVSALQKAIFEKSIRKTSKYATEIAHIQENVLSCYNKMGKSIDIEIDEKTLSKYNKIVAENEIDPEVSLLKRYKQLQGKTGVERRVELLRKAIEKALKEDAGNKKLIDIAKKLGEYSDTKKPIGFEIEQLNGFWDVIQVAAAGKQIADVVAKGLGSIDEAQSTAYKGFVINITPCLGGYSYNIFKQGQAKPIIASNCALVDSEKCIAECKQIIDLSEKKKLEGVVEIAEKGIDGEPTNINAIEVDDDGFTRADQRNKVDRAGTFKLQGEIGKIFGHIQPFMYAVVLKGDTHAGKTEVLMQALNAFASAKKKIALFSIEQGGVESKNTTDAMDRNITKENQSRIAVTGQAKNGIDTLRKYASQFDVIAVDSWQKLGLPNTKFDDLRQEFPNTIWLTIFQQNSEGGTRGGVSADFDTPVIFKVHKVDNTFVNNYVEVMKNRGNMEALQLKYMVADKKTLPIT